MTYVPGCAEIRSRIMGDGERPALWKRNTVISPGVAALLGVALGCFLAILCAFTPPEDFSPGFLAMFLAMFVPGGGTFGYILWLSGDRSRYDRFLGIWSRVTVLLVLGLLVAFPSFWWHGVSSIGPLLVMMLMGGICAMAMFAVGAGWGIVHLVDHLVSTFWHPDKPVVVFRTDGVWDRELDQYGISID